MRSERSESSSSAFTRGRANIQYAAMRRIGHWLTSSWIDRVLWGICVLGFLWLRIQIPVRDLQATGLVALRDLVLTLVLWFLVLILCLSLGNLLLRFIKSRKHEGFGKECIRFCPGIWRHGILDPLAHFVSTPRCTHSYSFIDHCNHSCRTGSDGLPQKAVGFAGSDSQILERNSHDRQSNCRYLSLDCRSELHQRAYSGLGL